MSARDDFIERAYLKWRLPLFRFLKRKLGNEAEAEELTQESFARWAASTAQGMPENPRAYVTRIALNAMSSRKHGQAAVMAVPLDEGGGCQGGVAAIDAACPQRHAQNRQMLERIGQALQELPERQREAFTLHRFDGLSYEEIAAEMQISRALVSRLISQAVAYCRLRADYPSRQAMQMAVHSRDAVHEA